MAYYVSAKSYAEQKDELVGVSVVLIGGDLKPLIDTKKASNPDRKTSVRNRGKNPRKQ